MKKERINEKLFDFIENSPSPFHVVKNCADIMQNIKVGCVPVRQAVKIDTISLRIKKFIKNNKLGLIIGGISLTLLSIYIVLFINFINLIKSINIY